MFLVLILKIVKGLKKILFLSKILFMQNFILFLIINIFITAMSFSQKNYEEDVYKTSDGTLKITFIGHASLMFTLNDKVIYIDPAQYSGSDFDGFPKADLILITHNHFDHFDIPIIEKLSKENTKIVYTEICSQQLPGSIIMKNGDKNEVCGFTIEAIPAYNIIHKRGDGNPFHPKGEGNGYIITIGDKRIYIAGDTENIPEMKALKNIDIAFLPMNLPFTMSPEMVADAAKVFKPKVLYPYHLTQTDTNGLLKLMKDEKDVEVIIRKM